MDQFHGRTSGVVNVNRWNFKCGLYRLWGLTALPLSLTHCRQNSGCAECSFKLQLTFPTVHSWACAKRWICLAVDKPNPHTFCRSKFGRPPSMNGNRRQTHWMNCCNACPADGQFRCRRDLQCHQTKMEGHRSGPYQRWNITTNSNTQRNRPNTDTSTARQETDPPVASHYAGKDLAGPTKNHHIGPHFTTTALSFSNARRYVF